MTVLAARVGQKPRALNRPMLQLKKAGRVRSAGQRNLTRYFPMAAASGDHGHKAADRSSKLAGEASPWTGTGECPGRPETYARRKLRIRLLDTPGPRTLGRFRCARPS
jgi:hypothetical protein